MDIDDIAVREYDRNVPKQKGSRLPIRQFRLVMVGSGVVHNGHGKTIKS